MRQLVLSERYKEWTWEDIADALIAAGFGDVAKALTMADVVRAQIETEQTCLRAIDEVGDYATVAAYESAIRNMLHRQPSASEPAQDANHVRGICDKCGWSGFGRPMIGGGVDHPGCGYLAKELREPAQEARDETKA